LFDFIAIWTIFLGINCKVHMLIIFVNYIEVYKECQSGSLMKVY
jgi:hypothetical protein